MSHTYSHCLVHLVFATAGRHAWIGQPIANRLHAYLGGICRDKGFPALAIGGHVDHVHMLISITATIPIAKAVQMVKGCSSGWIHETFPQLRSFAWQEGYGAFSVGLSARARTITYIRNQVEHHRTRTFADEYLGFLSRHGIAFDRRHVLG